MNNFSKICLWSLVLILLLGRQMSFGSGSFPSPVKEILLEPISELTTNNPVRFSVTFVPKEDFGDKLTFQIAGTNGLTTVGSDTRILSYNDEGNFETEFEIMIPKNDTSRLTVQILKKSIGSLQARFFVTTADTVEYYRAHPKDVARHSFLSSEGGAPLIKIDIKPTPQPDSNTYQFRTEPAPRSEYQLLEMRRIEKVPLTDAQVQYFNVGDSLYRRFEGEKEFTLVPKRTMDEILADKKHYLDSIAVLPPDAEIRVCVDLRRPSQLEFVKDMVGPLVKPESESYYHLTITKAMLEQLKEQGIPIMYLDIEDNNHKPHPSDQSDPSDLQGNTPNLELPDGKGVDVVIYSETFASGWDYDWLSLDDNANCGYDAWGESWLWTYSIWVAGTGDQIDGNPYAPPRSTAAVFGLTKLTVLMPLNESTPTSS